MKPILINTEMVRAILDGRKTTTRRVVKLPKYVKTQENGLYTLFADGTFYEDQRFEEITKYILPYHIGDVLYVRETFGTYRTCGIISYAFKADYIDPENLEKAKSLVRRWRPSIHMPKEAARLFLRVTGVKAERLQDITENGAKAEGMVYTDFGMYQPSWKASVDGGKTFYPAKEQHHFGWNSGSAKGPGECFPTSRGAFAHLWDSTVNKSDLDHYGWSANPWVWVISFERTARPNEK